MLDYINVTPIIEPVVSWANIAPFEPKRPTREFSVSQTRTARSKPFNLFAQGTGVSAPTAVADERTVGDTLHTSVVSEFSLKTSPYSNAGATDTDIERIANQRVKLMAAKYASSAASAELVARLEILNRRLLDRAPRVSMDQLEALESADAKLAQIRAAREERSKRLGLSA